MQDTRKHIISRLLWFVLALHIFNCSLYTPNTHKDHIQEDLSYNNIEDIAKMVIEKILNLHGPITENEENSTGEGDGCDLEEEIVFFHQKKVEHDIFYGNGLYIVASTEYDDKYRSQFQQLSVELAKRSTDV
jgi:hypothetical protein